MTVDDPDAPPPDPSDDPVRMGRQGPGAALRARPSVTVRVGEDCFVLRPSRRGFLDACRGETQVLVPAVALAHARSVTLACGARVPACVWLPSDGADAPPASYKYRISAGRLVKTILGLPTPDAIARTFALDAPGVREAPGATVKDGTPVVVVVSTRRFPPAAAARFAPAAAASAAAHRRRAACAATASAAP